MDDESMRIVEDIKPITFLKTRAADLVQQVNETQRPVIITQNGEPRAVLQDPKSYEDMRNTLGILRLLAMGEADVKVGRVQNQEEFFSALEKKVGEE